MSTTDLMYEVGRAVRDVQSRVAIIDRRLGKLTQPSDPTTTGERFFKLATAFLLRSKSDHARADQVERAATGPALTSQATWAAELTGTTVGGLLLSIQKQSAYAAIASRTPAFTVGPDLQRVLIGGEITCGFIGEGQAIGVSQGALSSQTLTPKKIASIAVLTDELDQRSAPNIEATLRQLMSAGLASALDSTFFGTAAASSAAPAGILNGVSAIIASAATPAEAALRADLKALIGALTSPSDPCFIMHPTRLIFASSALPSGFAYPMFASEALPATRVICVDASALVAAHAPEPRFAKSADATLHMESAAPLPLATGPQGSAVMAAPTVSTYQADLLALRTILIVAWALRAGGVAYVDNVVW